MYVQSKKRQKMYTPFLAQLLVHQQEQQQQQQQQQQEQQQQEEEEAGGDIKGSRFINSRRLQRNEMIGQGRGPGD